MDERRTDPYTGRQNAANLIAGRPGVNKRFRESNEPIMAWKCYFTDEVFAKTIVATNQKIADFRNGLGQAILGSGKYPYFHDTNYTRS